MLMSVTHSELTNHKRRAKEPSNAERRGRRTEADSEKSNMFPTAVPPTKVELRYRSDEIGSWRGAI